MCEITEPWQALLLQYYSGRKENIHHQNVILWFKCKCKIMEKRKTKHAHKNN